MMQSYSASPTVGDTLPTSFKDSNVKVKTTEEQIVGDTLLGSQHFGGRGACWNSEMGLGRMKST
jgi:hypothetical protein